MPTAVVRRDQDAETGAVDERHPREVDADDTATCDLLLLEYVGQGVPRGEIQLAGSGDGRSQRIEIDHGQLESEISVGHESPDTCHDDAPSRSLRHPGSGGAVSTMTRDPAADPALKDKFC